MSKTINATAINTAVRNALRAAHTYGTCVAELRSLLRGVQREDAQSVITPEIGKFYGVAVNEGQRGVTFDKAAPKYAAAIRARSRLLASVYAGTSAHKEPAVVRFNRQRVEAIQGAIAGMSKDEARAYLKRAYELAFPKAK